MHNKLVNEIIKLLFLFKRTTDTQLSCDSNCISCRLPHFEKLASFIQANKPILFVLPAFPAKSPNLQKVFGHLPDMGEKLALNFLEQLTKKIQHIYSPGAQIIICADGRVFNDIIGISDINVSEYQKELQQTIFDLKLSNINLFNLDDLYKTSSNFAQMRSELIDAFGETLDRLKEKVQSGAKFKSANEEQAIVNLYCGITRFLVEDSSFPNQDKSKTAIQKECKLKAYQVIQRSNAWSELISQRFPDAIRLSIHPQFCGAKKLGIRLIGNENWMTPWHGVAVNINNSYMLLKRKEAEILGGKLIYASNGRPSHFELPISNYQFQSIDHTEVSNDF